MSMYLGDIAEDATIRFLFSTNDSDGASITITTAGAVSVYKDASATQMITGVTYSGADFDSLVGIIIVEIDTSADAFYATGSDYHVVLSASTIDGQTVNSVLAHFSIENRFAEVDVTKIGGAAQSATDLKDFADAGYDPATNKVQGVVLADTVTTVTGVGTDGITATSIATDAIGQQELAQTAVFEIRDAILTDSTSFNGADVGAILTDTGTTLPSSLSDIETDTQDIQTKIGTPVALDGGAATVGGMLTKMADDNAGATFDATDDSLNAIRDRGDAAWTSGAGSGLTPLASGTAQGGSASTIQLAAGETFADDELNGQIAKITSGTGAGQARLITDYTGATDTADVSPNWITNPDATSVYEVVEGPANLIAIAGDVQSVTDIKDFADAGYDPATNKVEGVKLVDTTTTNTDMVGTDSAATAAALATAQADLDILTGTDGATLATAQGNYAPATAAALSTHDGKLDTVDANVDTLLTRITSTLFSGITSLAEWLGLMAGKQVANATALTEVKATGAGSGTFDEGTDSLEALKDTVGVGGANLGDLGGMSAAMKAEVNAEADTALSDYDPPTNTEMEARTLLAASYATATNQTNIEADTQDIQTTLGTVPALDGGAQTVGAAIAKIADDNGGADFDSTTDSLEKIAAASGAASPWDALIASHDTEDTFGNVVNDLVQENGGTGVYEYTTAALGNAPSGTGQTQYFVLGGANQDDENTITWHAYCLKNGAPTAGTDCTVQLYKDDGDGTITEVTGATDTVESPDANGVFNESMEVALDAGALYYYYVTMTVDAASRAGFITLQVPERTAS